MASKEGYENYPAWMIIVTNLVTLSIYILGVIILSGYGFIVVSLYLLYILWIEARLLTHCTNCFYYGRLCCFGRGRVASCVLKKGKAKKFMDKEIRWIDILPDFLVSLIPLTAAIIFLVTDYSLVLLTETVLLFVLAFPVTGILRGNWACRYCRQKDIGCKAQELFKKKE